MCIELTLQGRRIEQGDLAWLQSWIDENPDWSRKQIARAVHPEVVSEIAGLPAQEGRW
jgi:hypothetical protein